MFWCLLIFFHTQNQQKQNKNLFLNIKILEAIFRCLSLCWWFEHNLTKFVNNFFCMNLSLIFSIFWNNITFDWTTNEITRNFFFLFTLNFFPNSISKSIKLISYPWFSVISIFKILFNLTSLPQKSLSEKSYFRNLNFLKRKNWNRVFHSQE